MNMKKILVVMLILSVFTLSGCGSKKKNEPIPQEQKLRVNTNEAVIGSKEIDGLSIAKASLVYENGISTLTTSIRNISSDTINVDHVEITYFDNEGNTTVLIGEVGEAILKNQTVYITSTTDVDLTKAVRAEYVVVK